MCREVAFPNAIHLYDVGYVENNVQLSFEEILTRNVFEKFCTSYSKFFMISGRTSCIHSFRIMNSLRIITLSDFTIFHFIKLIFLILINFLLLWKRLKWKRRNIFIAKENLKKSSVFPDRMNSDTIVRNWKSFYFRIILKI